MRSLLARLTAGLVLSLLVLSVVQWVAVGFATHRLLEDYVAGRLEHDTENLLSALRFGPGGTPQVDPRRVQPVFQRPFSGHYFDIAVRGVRGGTRHLRSRSLWDTDLPLPAVAPGQRVRERVSGPRGQRLLALASGFRKQGHALVIAVAEDLTPVYAEARRFQWWHSLVSLAVVLVLVLVQTWIVRMSLRPLAAARRDVLRLERGEVSRLSEDLPTEVQPLVQEINRLLELVHQRLERSRNALGKLAHGMKAPLTRLTQLLDGAALERDPRLRAQLGDQIQSLRAIIDRQLKRARLAGGAPAGGRVRLEEEIPALLEVLRGIYRDRGLHLEADIAPQALFAGDREDFLELAGNLLDNACKWARSRVRIRARVSATDLVMSVEDDGPGVSEGEREHLLERGARADESTPGHGLGLSIVRDILEPYGGRIGLDASPEWGGLRVRVTLPLGAPHVSVGGPSG